MKPLVSVIIPVYNTGIFIKECHTSIINQTYNNIEIIYVDDGSTDDSGKLLDDYAKADNRVMVVHTDNHGCGAARNIGLENARGEWLSFLDSDDIMYSRAIEYAVRVAKTEKSDVVHFNYSNLLKNDSDGFNDRTRLSHRIIKSYNPFEMRDFFNTLVGRVTTKLFSRKIINDNNIKFQEIPTRNDTFFCFASCLKSNRISMIDLPLYGYRIRTESISHKAAQSIKNDFAAMKALKDFMKDNEIYDYFERDFINMLIPEVFDYAFPRIDSRFYLENLKFFHDEWIPEFALEEKDKDFYYYAYYYYLVDIAKNFSLKETGGANCLVQSMARKLEIFDNN